MDEGGPGEHERRLTGDVTGGTRHAQGLVIAVLGPTGVGKSAVGVELARALGVRVISCDSMQVYSGFPVLTNQPRGPGEGRELHDLVGFQDPRSAISAGEYAELAQPLIERDVDAAGRAVVVGGSGLYMRAVLAPLAAPGPADRESRQKLEARAREKGGAALHAELAELDPEAAGAIDPRNVRRVVRALESVLGGNRWSGRDDLWRPKYFRPTLIVGLTLDRDLLGERIASRTAMMVENGAIEEVRHFCEASGGADCTPGGAGIRSAIGYGEIWRYLVGEHGLAETIEQIERATHRYARRQHTWLRKAKDAVMIDVQGMNARQIASEILALADEMSAAKGS